MLSGDITSAGHYVLRNKWPPNTSLAPHTHGDKWRVYTVLEGEVYWGFGTKFDRAGTVRLGPGGVAVTGPGDPPHFFFVGDKGVTLNVTAEGPFVTEFAKTD